MSREGGWRWFALTAVVTRGFDRESSGLDMLIETALGSQKITPAAFLSSGRGTIS